MDEMEELKEKVQNLTLELESQKTSGADLQLQLEEQSKLFDESKQVFNNLLEDPKFAGYFNPEEPAKQVESEINVQEQEAINKVKQISADVMNPVAEQVANMRITNIVDELAIKYPGWSQYQEAITEKQATFPFRDSMNPTKNELEALFLMAARDVDGDAGVEVLINEPPLQLEVENELPKNLTAEQALDLAREQLARR